jgi:hypothetical protein
MAHKAFILITSKKYKPCNQEMTCGDKSFMNNCWANLQPEFLRVILITDEAGFTLAVKISGFKSCDFFYGSI